MAIAKGGGVTVGADWELGFWGMMRWGVASSTILSLASIFIPMAPFLVSGGSTAGAGFFVVIGLVITPIVVTVVWGFGGLIVALPLWGALRATGLRASGLRWALIASGAVAVGGIWGWFNYANSATAVSIVLATVAGALSGALGGYGFCRAAMRS